MSISVMKWTPHNNYGYIQVSSRYVHLMMLENSMLIALNRPHTMMVFVQQIGCVCNVCVCTTQCELLQLGRWRSIRQTLNSSFPRGRFARSSFTRWTPQVTICSWMSACSRPHRCVTSRRSSSLWHPSRRRKRIAGELSGIATAHAFLYRILTNCTVMNQVRPVLRQPGQLTGDLHTQGILRCAQNVYCTYYEHGAPLPDGDQLDLSRFSRLTQLSLLHANRGSLGGVGVPATWLPASLQASAAAARASVLALVPTAAVAGARSADTRRIMCIFRTA